MTPPAVRRRPLPCGCWKDTSTGIITHFCPEHAPFEIDITRANDLIAEWGLIARSIARQCKWRPRGKCLAECKGLAVCNLEGLTLVDYQGRPVAHNPQGGPN